MLIAIAPSAVAEPPPPPESPAPGTRAATSEIKLQLARRHFELGATCSVAVPFADVDVMSLSVSGGSCGEYAITWDDVKLWTY